MRGRLTSAQRHNLVLGWWSFLSILFMNWLSLLSNAGARATLRKRLREAEAYAQWWYQHGQHQNTPQQPQRQVGRSRRSDHGFRAGQARRAQNDTRVALDHSG